MAIVYSLVCFGGKDGRAVTASNSGGYLLLTATKNGVRSGLKVYFSGTLPGNIASTSTPYYLRNETIDTCTVYDTQAHAIAGGTTGKVAWSSAGSSVKITSGYWYELAAGSGTTGRARYGSSGSERCYDGLLAARNARYSAAVATDVEVIEFATQWFDYQTALLSLNIPAAEVRLTPTVDEAPTDAAHGGILTQCTHNGASVWLPNGYIIDQQTYYLYGTIELSGTRHTVEGISISTDQTNTYGVAAPVTGLYNTVKRCAIFAYGSAATLRIGLYHRQDTLDFVNNLIYGFTGTSSMGLQVYGYDSGNGSTVANNTVVNCATGFGSANTGTSPKGWFRNNISLGNTTNWGTSGTGSMHGVGYNAGLSGEAWGATGRVTMATTDFADFANYDFRPAASSSPQVDTGVVIIGMTAEDLAQDERPNYNNGGAEAYDVGCYEFDAGYTRPQVREITVSGFVTGTQVKIFTTGTQDVLDSVTSGTSITYDAGADGVTVDVTVLKAGKIFQQYTGIALTAESYTLTVTQADDQNYVASSGLTYGTNFTYDATVAGGNKYLKVNAATSGRNLYSALIEAFIAETSLENIAFNFEMNGPGGLILKNGAETRGYSTAGTGISNTSLGYLTDDGLTYLNTSGAATAIWAAFITQGVPSGKQARYQQVDGSGTTNAEATGDVNQLIQVYGGASHGNFDYRARMVWKVQSPGYDEARFDAVATYGNMEGQGYVVPLVPVANGIADASGITNLTFTDHGASPVTWNSKDFSITIEDDDDSHTGEEIIQWIRNANNFNRHDLVQENGTAYKTVRGALEGDTGATLKGVRVVRSDGTTAHYDFTLFTADDGTTYEPVIPANATATVLADTRVQLYNVTQDAEIDNAFVSGTSYSFEITTEADPDDVLRLRVCKKGRQADEASAVWTTAGVEFLVSQPEDNTYTAWGINGSTVSEFALDVTGTVEIDADDADGVSSKVRLGAWYSYILTTEEGIRNLYGAITFLSTAAIRINVDVLDLKIENISATMGLQFSDPDVRLYRSDGTNLFAATSLPGSIYSDYTGVPDVVETGVSGLTGPESSQLMSLTNAPSASANATAAWEHVIEAGLTAEEVLRIIAAPLAGKASGAGTGTETFTGLDGSTARVVSSNDSSGNRTAVVVDGA